MLNSKSLLKVSAGLLLVSTIGFSGKAHAQSVDVPFSGVEPASCAFTAPTAGVLAKVGASAAMEGSAGVTGFNVGTSGKVSVTCSNGGTLTTAVPAPTAALPAGFTPGVVQAVVQRGAAIGIGDFTSANTGGNFDTGVWNKPTAAMVIPANAATALNVAMVTGNRAAGAVPSGTYSYNVKLTVVSN